MSEELLEVEKSEIGIAIDIGTTTVVCESYLKSTRECLASVIRQNTQVRHGYDVHHRVGFSVRKFPGAEEGVSTTGVAFLHSDLMVQLDEMLSELIENSEKECFKIHDIDSELVISDIVITGNTIMLSAAIGLPCDGFKVYPYSPVSLFGFDTTWHQVRSATIFPSYSIPFEFQPHLKKESPVNGNVPVYFPPCIGAFIGADAVCAMMTAGFSGPILDSNEELLPDESPITAPLLLVDIGTTCELALYVPGKDGRESKLTCTTVTVGPAFECSNILCGMSPVEGAIDKVTYEKDNFNFHVIGDVRPKGICCQGLLSLISVLYKNNFVDNSGRIIKKAQKTGDGESYIELTPAVRITQQDIKNLQIAKSALRTGIEFLLERTSSSPIVSICGGCGPLLSIQDAVSLGVIPESISKHTIRLGNAALKGAASLLFSKEMRNRAKKLSMKAQQLDLSREAQFQQRFLSAMDL